jgi:hypothetical protein
VLEQEQEKKKVEGWFNFFFQLNYKCVDEDVDD